MYLKSPEEMEQLFGQGSEPILNTLRIAEMCQGLKLRLDEPMLPHFPVPEGHTADSYFKHVAEEGLEQRFAEFRTAGKTIDEPGIANVCKSRLTSSSG